MPQNTSVHDITPKAAIFQVLKQIPKGKVVTYGQLASLAGLGKAARYAGTTLKNLPHDSQLPWHRVVNSQGRISFPSNHPNYQTQADRLSEDGVVIVNQKIDLKYYQWKPEEHA